MLRSFSCLQGKIFFVVFGKIQGFGLFGDPLAGIIFEAAALAFLRLETFLCTEDHSVFQTCTIQTVTAGTFDLLSKQHSDTSGSFCSHYTGTIPGFPYLFSNFLKIIRKIRIRQAAIHPFLWTTALLSRKLKRV